MLRAQPKCRETFFSKGVPRCGHPNEAECMATHNRALGDVPRCGHPNEDECMATHNGALGDLACAAIPLSHSPSHHNGISATASAHHTPPPLPGCPVACACISHGAPRHMCACISHGAHARSHTRSGEGARPLCSNTHRTHAQARNTIASPCNRKHHRRYPAPSPVRYLHL